MFNSRNWIKSIGQVPAVVDNSSSSRQLQEFSKLFNIKPSRINQSFSILQLKGFGKEKAAILATLQTECENSTHEICQTNLIHLF